jgi:two-component system OmpR family response regulator
VRILLVEDEQSVAAFIVKGLREEAYTVDHAADGAVGLRLAQEETYDLIVLDVSLPELDGFNLCRKLRSEGNATPILMLTARGTVPDRVRGLDAGADDYLTKPFAFDELLARARALLRRGRDTLLELKAGPVCIDVLKRRVTVGKTAVELRPKEYAILEYLLRNPGRVLSRTQILENVWGYEFNPNTNLVDVHVKALRQKLAEGGAMQVIETVRGSGYRVAEQWAETEAAP